MVDFPNSPTDGQLHTEGPMQWIYRDPPGAWQVVSQGGVPVPIVEADLDGGGNGWQVWGDILIQWGTNTQSDLRTVTFPQPFKTTPRVQLTPQSTFSAGVGARRVPVVEGGSVTTTGFQFFVMTNTDATNTSVLAFWLAIGEAPDELKKAKTVQAAGGMPLADLIAELQPTFGRYGEITAENVTVGQSSIQLAGIPEWVNHVEITISLLSQTGDGSLNLRLGTPSGMVTSGYSSVVQRQTVGSPATITGNVSNAQFQFAFGLLAANSATCTVKLTRYAGNIWQIIGQGFDGPGNLYQSSGRINLGSDALSRIAVFCGAGTFTSGGIGLRYWS